MGNQYLEDLDVQLMLRVRQGDQEAFASLVERHAPMLVNFMSRYIGCRATGEDLAQDVFLRVFKAAPSYEPKARFKTWLLTIATNICLNRQRWQKHRNHLSLCGEDEEGCGMPASQLDSGRPGPEAAAEKEELKARVREAIASLPERQRVAILLYRYEQFSYAEIAANLGMSLMAVKSLLNRAKEGLRARLSRELQEWYPVDTALPGSPEQGVG